MEDFYRENRANLHFYTFYCHEVPHVKKNESLEKVLREATSAPSKKVKHKKSEPFREVQNFKKPVPPKVSRRAASKLSKKYPENVNSRGYSDRKVPKPMDMES